MRGEGVNHLPGAGSEGKPKRESWRSALFSLASFSPGGNWERGGKAAKRRDPAFVSYPPPGDKTGGELGGQGDERATQAKPRFPPSCSL